MNAVAYKRFSAPFSFFLFIGYIIFLADTADYNFAFRVVGHIPYGDKVAHALLYGIMALLLNVSLGFRRVPLCCFLSQNKAETFVISLYKSMLRNTLYLGSFVVLTFAILEECTQYYIPSRTFDFWDVVADFLGVMVISWFFSRSQL